MSLTMVITQHQIWLDLDKSPVQGSDFATAEVPPAVAQGVSVLQDGCEDLTGTVKLQTRACFYMMSRHVTRARLLSIAMRAMLNLLLLEYRLNISQSL
jgi:hypothetical protein